MILDTILNKRNIKREDLNFDREENLNFPELDEAVNDTIQELYLNENMEGKNVGVFYDVDVDGLYSGHIMEDFLNRFEKFNVLRHMNTGKEHGITDQTIKWVEENDIKFLFVVDAGSTNEKEIKYLVDKGTKVIILDHHPYEPFELPKGAWLVNISKYKDLPPISGCGVTYRYIEKIAKFFNLSVKDYEVFVGITTISDMVAVNNSENRYYIKRAFEGRQATLFLRKFKFWGSALTFYGWQVVPYLNALIRVGFEKRALDVVNNMNRVAKMQRIDKDVIRIKDLQKEMTEDLYQNSEIKENEHVVLCLRKGKDSYKTLNGLVGNKLVSEKGKSALVLYYDYDDKKWKGSFRGKQFTNKDLNEWGFKTQGHPQACGVVVEHSVLLNFFKKAKFAKYEKPKADIYVDESEITDDDFLEIAKLNEYTGVGFPPIKIGFKKGLKSVQAVDDSNKKRRILILDKFEVIDFSEDELNIDLNETEHKELVVTPTLSLNGYQLIKE